MLHQAAENLQNILTDSFSPFPKWEDGGWKTLTETCRKELIAHAEAAASQQLPVLRASLYMDYVRNGNRSRYEGVYFDRRAQLAQLLLGECAEGHGRFIDAIIDRLWAICEESSWVIPAHNTPHFGGDMAPLADTDELLPYIDLFSAETASLVTWTYYFLADRLERESPLIPRRIEREIKRRIINPYLERSDMWWMGLENRNMVNNWNPWINSNIVPAFLVFEKDPLRRVAGVKKAARSAQRFLDFYHEDGGCDEGPSYFTVAGASMLDLLELLYDATRGALSLFDRPLIANMADYIRHVHINDRYFVNYADAPGILAGIPAGLLIRAGRLTNNSELIDFGRAAYREGLSPMPWSPSRGQQFYRTLKTLFDFSADDLLPGSATPSAGHYFPGIQVAIGRTEGNLFFSAKGGHNNESHNHNDIGSYILYANGAPCVIDVGVGVYSKKTFSDRRYEIWAMQSGYHNTAIINGADQLPGEEYAAHDVCYEDHADKLVFSLNIEKAYAPQAKLSTYRRRFELNRADNTLTVSDSICTEECTEPVVLPVMCHQPPVIGNGCVDLNGLMLRFDPEQFTASFEELDLNDPENPIRSWGKSTLYRLLLTRTERKATDKWTLRYALT